MADRSERTDGLGARTERWWKAGATLLALSLVLLVPIQALKHDWLPPEISVSQYGVGRYGWLFSLWLVMLVAAPLCFLKYRPAGRLAAVLLWTAAAGALLMAIVRTDPSGLQRTWNSQVHTAGAVVLLATLPFGIWFGLARADRRWQIAAWAFTVVSAISLILLLLAAGGTDTAGVGPQASWAFWQTVAILTEIGMAVLYAFAVRTVPAPRPAGTSVLSATSPLPE